MLHTAAPPFLQIEALTQRYGENTVLDAVDLSLPQRRTIALLGPSGCGKTTLLRLIAGLLQPSEGRVLIGGELVADARRFVPPERRGLGMVFQDYALWPHMSVAENVAFPLEMRGVPRAERETRVRRALERVELGAMIDRAPSDLSGGQQQRVAIARAIVAEPRLVLFDEPLSNLDRELRESLVEEIGGLIADLGLTAVYVTHDHGEAFALADQVAVMGGGRIVQLAPPDDLTNRPATPDVAAFLKLGTIAQAERRKGGWWLSGSGIRLADPDIALEGPSARVLIDRRAITIAGHDTGCRGEVVRSRFRGDAHHLTVRIGDGDGAIELHAASRNRHRVGEQVGLAIETDRLRWFASESHT